MSKAILIIDIPDSCSKCPFVEHEDEGWLYCSIHNGDTAFAFKRAEWCPLKPMPEKQEVSGYDGYCMNQCCTRRERGWNDCINKILYS